MQTSLKDETSQRYTIDVSALAIVKGGSIDGKLSPGEKIRGRIGFQVPEDVESLEYTFDADVFRSGKIFVDLGSEPVMVEAPSEIPGESEQETYNFDDTIEISNLVIKINEVSTPLGGQFIKLSDNYKFLVVDLTLENKASSSANISSLRQMWIKDSDDRKFSVSIFASATGAGTLPDGEYLAGETIRGQVGYEVPVDETQFVFVFDGDFWGSGTVFIEIPLEYR